VSVSRPRVPRALPFLLAAVAATLLIAGCGRDQPASALLGAQTFAPAEREPLPPLSGPTLDGGTLDIASLRGKVVVLNAWASWCTPCRAEIPAFVALAKSSAASDVAVVGLDVQDDDAAARDFAADFAMTYPSIVDTAGSVLSTIPGVPPSAIPSTVVLDRDGRIAARIIGGADATELDQIVTDLTAESASPRPS
jgi:thiol-disulfide isomerase/thioredoxin